MHLAPQSMRQASSTAGGAAHRLRRVDGAAVEAGVHLRRVAGRDVRHSQLRLLRRTHPAAPDRVSRDLSSKQRQGYSVVAHNHLRLADM